MISITGRDAHGRKPVPGIRNRHQARREAHEHLWQACNSHIRKGRCAVWQMPKPQTRKGLPRLDASNLTRPIAPTSVPLSGNGRFKTPPWPTGMEVGQAALIPPHALLRERGHNQDEDGDGNEP